VRDVLARDLGAMESRERRAAAKLLLRALVLDRAVAAFCGDAP